MTAPTLNESDDQHEIELLARADRTLAKQRNAAKWGQRELSLAKPLDRELQGFEHEVFGASVGQMLGKAFVAGLPVYLFYSWAQQDHKFDDFWKAVVSFVGVYVLGAIIAGFGLWASGNVVGTEDWTKRHTAAVDRLSRSIQSCESIRNGSLTVLPLQRQLALLELENATSAFPIKP